MENLELSGSMQSQVLCTGEAHITKGGLMCGVLNSKNMVTDQGAEIKAQVNLGEAAMPKAAAPAPAAEPAPKAEPAPAEE